MKILGISYGHDSNVAVIDDGKILYAISEERLNRKKFHRGFPFLSIRSALENTGLMHDDFDVIALVDLNTQHEALGGNLKTFYARVNRRVPWYANMFSTPISLIDNILQLSIRRTIAKQMVLKTLNQIGFDTNKVSFVDHHLAHAAGAFFLSGFEEALVFTVDGKGDHVSHRSYRAGQGIFEKLSESTDGDSAGHFYSCITTYLGFKRLRHEGKITGLAAHGNFEKVSHIASPLGLDEKSLVTKNLIFPERESNNIYLLYKNLLKKDPTFLMRMLAESSAIRAWYSQYCYEEYFKSSFDGIPREHVAAFAQKHLEDTVVKLVNRQVMECKIPHVCLSGGTFGNVRLNQKILELDGVENVYIQPAMGDGGLGVGGAIWKYWSSEKKWDHKFLRNVYLGPKFSEVQIENALKKYRLKYMKVDNVEMRIAEALVDKKIIGRFTGHMEWGPRALGNRTILVTAEDAGINQLLNERLGRTEFMPFAPIILEEFSENYFKDYKQYHLAARFMTITYNVVDEKQSLIPAVVHVDGTARPQVVGKHDNPSLYKVLSGYYRLTGIPVLINTSFNMHEEPIVCTPEDAVRAYQQGAVDILAIGDYWVE